MIKKQIFNGFTINVSNTKNNNQKWTNVYKRHDGNKTLYFLQSD